MNTFVAIVTSRAMWRGARLTVTDGTVTLLPGERRVLRIDDRGWYFWWFNTKISVSLRVQAKGRWVQ